MFDSVRKNAVKFIVIWLKLPVDLDVERIIPALFVLSLSDIDIELVKIRDAEVYLFWVNIANDLRKVNIDSRFHCESFLRDIIFGHFKDIFLHRVDPKCHLISGLEGPTAE